MELQSKKVLVAGLGKTGISTARFLTARGAYVTVSDNRKRVNIPRDLLRGDVLIEAGYHDIGTFTRQDLIVVSPGVPLTIRPMIEAQARGIEVISEVELAYRFLRTPIIAITGTNGKTTTASLIAHILSAAGKKIFTGGNIGTPLIDYVSGTHDCDYVVAEISSFQLEGIRTFRPRISALLNITEDHLDRYASFEEYVRAKARIFMNQTAADIAVINADDPHTARITGTLKPEAFRFSTRGGLKTGACDNGLLHLHRPGQPPVEVATNGVHLSGKHNRENMLAAASVAYLCHVPAASIESAMRSFQGLEHRMELVGRIGGVSFYNDSKGTNVGACLKSLESLKAPLILIAGGKDKGGSYLPLKPLLTAKGKALILFGEAKERMALELSSSVDTFIADSLSQAVTLAYEKAGAGDSILLSPACSSFDMFKSYEHRGRCFKEAVARIRKHRLKDM